MGVLVTCTKKEEPIKNEGARVVTGFPHYNPMGAICCHGNKSSKFDLSQNLMQSIPHPNNASDEI